VTPTDEYLLDLAQQAEIRIEYTRLRDGRDGEYIHARKLIRLRHGMSARLHRSVLAHELGHAAMAHAPTRFGPVHAKQERAAEEWAALRLISPADYCHVEELHGGHAGAMALELGVMRSIVDAFRALLLRIEVEGDQPDLVYLQSKMGDGMWAHREGVA
jgi:Zn-dependent peptidase ImmA (M78 family)